MIGKILLIVVPVAAIGFWFWKKGIYTLAKRRAVAHLESVLFSNGMTQKEEVIDSMNEITKNKYSSEDLLDYFLKIKGLQVINTNDPIDFWIKKYLTSPTALKLNYFEQVKFYETFLNYPTKGSKMNKAPQQEKSERPKGLFYPKKQLA